MNFFEKVLKYCEQRGLEYAEHSEPEIVGRRKFSLKLVKPQNDEHVLNVGCGRGWLEKSLVSRCNVVVGIDITKRKVMISHRRVKDAHFVVASAPSLPFKSFFDKVICLEVIEHLPRGVDVVALGEIRRVLKNKHGIFILSTPNDTFFAKLSDVLFLKSIFDMHSSHKHYKLKSLQSMLSGKGLIIEKAYFRGGLLTALLSLFKSFLIISNQSHRFRRFLHYPQSIDYERNGNFTIFLKGKIKRMYK